MSPSVILEIFPVLILNALEITGFYIATWYKQADPKDHQPEEETKMAFWWVKFYSLKWLGPFLSKPICTCPPCMASLHSLWFWMFFDFSPQMLAVFILYMLALCGLMKMITVKFEL